MNDTVTTDNEPATAEPGARRRRPSKTTLLAAIATTLVLAAVGGGALLWPKAGDADADGPSASTASPSYVDAPAMVVNLRSADGRAHFLKLRFVIVASSASKTALITERMPVVIDALQSFLRELRPEDLKGSAAVFRVKEEMMIRAQTALGKGSVAEILIQDLVEQ